MKAAPFLDHLSSRLKSIGVKPGRLLVGLPLEAAPPIIAALSGLSVHPLVVIVGDDDRASALRDGLVDLLGMPRILFCPAGGGNSDMPPGFTAPLQWRRHSALARLAAEGPPAVFIGSERLLEEGLPPVDGLRGRMLDLRPGAIGYDALRDWLEEAEYEPVSLVTEPGTFALRGGVIDVFPVNEGAPVRLDFLDDFLETVREFDIHSQIGGLKLSGIGCMPVTHDAAETVPLTALFFQGWRMIRQSDSGNDWLYTTGEDGAGDLKSDLGIDLIEGMPASPELLSERWNMLLRDSPAARIWYADLRSDWLSRAQKHLPEIPLKLLPAPLGSSFVSATLGCMVLSPAELWGFTRPVGGSVKHVGAPSVANIQKHVEQLEPGDPLVHVNHGVAKYVGLTHLSIGDTREECLVLEYAHGDKVYVSTDKINLVYPYEHQGRDEVPLDSLQSKRWERVKRQTRRSAEEVVDQLAQLYADRSLAVGVKHPPDDELQAALAATFPYRETPDQIKAIADVSADMEHSKPMDRLLCGDVGFGKTEVALRAAFKAIRGGGQVAVLAPTTILADQHMISFRARLEPLAVRVRLLSRFVKPAARKAVLRDISTGSVDLVIGTHRLLSGDVNFKNLTLLIVDEEHRFGVKQKEKVKQLKANLDILSLTATPIPRTLHISLAGIRDISRLDTPPLERIPIITAVTYYGDKVVAEAVRKEVARGGQVYFVHNEVQSIARVARDLGDLLPEVSARIAHGQMDGGELEETMFDFAEGKFQMLICSSIIESGIDLPNVNTVLIHNAQQFGLAQLYQIRGRVGRSSRQGYAYLLVRRRPKLTPVAIKRLKTIERHSALGSGYAIALKDLEIRGTGNVFGVEQSGHIAAVGLELYSKIIRGVLRERETGTGNAPSTLTPEQVTIRVDPGAELPESFVPDTHLRLNLYRRLASLEDTREVSAFREEIRDRFGPLPPAAESVLKAADLRIRALAANVVALRRHDEDISIDFAETADPASLLESVQSFLDSNALEYRFNNLRSGELRLHFHLQRPSQHDFLSRFLDTLGARPPH